MNAFSVVPLVSLSVPFVVAASYTNGCTSLRKASVTFIHEGCLPKSNRVTG